MIRLPRRTARLRLTALYGGLFLLFGAALVAGTYVLFQQASSARAPQLPRVPRTPTIKPLAKRQLPQALFQLSQDQHRLTRDQNQLRMLPRALGGPGPQLGLLSPVLRRDEHRLAEDQHKLAHATHQLAGAVHRAAQAGVVQAAQRASDSHELLVDSGIALTMVAAVALLAGWFVAGRTLRPIRTITQAARRISSTSLHERLALEGPEDELKELGDTLDDLFARLEAAFEAQRRFVAHASHELRTPLTRERALVQVALGDPSTSDAWRAAGEGSSSPTASRSRSSTRSSPSRAARAVSTSASRSTSPASPAPPWTIGSTATVTGSRSMQPSRPRPWTEIRGSSSASSPTSSTTRSPTTSRAAAFASRPAARTVGPR
ncbi:MAG TPA: HAMP domain-containing protein [Gaiellaceae bacterium]|nr:HAMP domain-containing protein [Gaiellaceae bacterium]